MALPMNDIPKVVFSRTGIKDGTKVDRMTAALAEAKARNPERPGVTPTAAVLQSWAEPTVARGDLVEEVLRLKEQSGNFILAHGGVRFAQSLVASGLIQRDPVQLWRRESRLPAGVSYRPRSPRPSDPHQT